MAEALKDEKATLIQQLEGASEKASRSDRKGRKTKAEKQIVSFSSIFQKFRPNIRYVNSKIVFMLKCHIVQPSQQDCFNLLKAITQ